MIKNITLSVAAEVPALTLMTLMVNDPAAVLKTVAFKSCDAALQVKNIKDDDVTAEFVTV